MRHDSLGARIERIPAGVGVTLVYPSHLDTRMGARYEAFRPRNCALEGW